MRGPPSCTLRRWSWKSWAVRVGSRAACSRQRRLRIPEEAIERRPQGVDGSVETPHREAAVCLGEQVRTSRQQDAHDADMAAGSGDEEGRAACDVVPEAAVHVPPAEAVRHLGNGRRGGRHFPRSRLRVPRNCWRCLAVVPLLRFHRSLIAMACRIPACPRRKYTTLITTGSRSLLVPPLRVSQILPRSGKIWSMSGQA